MTVSSRSRHVGKGRVGDVVLAVDDLAQDIARARAGDGILRPLLADRGELHVELRPQPLVAELHVLQHLGGVGRGGGDDEAVRRPSREVVPSSSTKPVLAQHQAVARPADGERLPGVGVEAVQELGRVRALQVDLAERGHVAHADARCAPRAPRGCTLSSQSVSPGRGYHCARSQSAGLDEHGAVLLRPAVRRRQAGRPEVLAAVRARQRADRDRRVGRAEGGGAGLRRWSWR